MHNSSCSRRYSRRRIAALSFLSNISLDGSRNDSKTRSDSCGGRLKGGNISCGNNETPSQYNDNAAACTFLEQDGKQQENHQLIDPTCATTVLPWELLSSQNALQILTEAVADLRDNEQHIHGGKKKAEDLAKSSKVGVSVFRERSATVGTSGSNSPVAYRARNVAFNQYDLKSTIQDSSENLELHGATASGYLLPITSSHNRRFSSNNSESSHSPTGSGFREKEVRFLTSISDFASQFSGQRMVLMTGQCSPIMVFSTLPFSKCNKLARGDFRGDSGRRRQTSGNRPTSSIGDFPDLYALLGLPKPEEGQVISYCQLLTPSWGPPPSHLSREAGSAFRKFPATHGDCCYELEVLPNIKAPNFPLARCLSQDASMFRSSQGRPSSPSNCCLGENPKTDMNEDGEGVLSSHVTYHPNLLDDPELWIAGKHSTLLTFPSYMTSIIDYVKPSDLKKELNNKFREKFPHIQLTLSKLRSLKREMRKVAKQDSGADLLTVAQSYVYFEKLILRGLVHKGNRKLCAGAALLLSAKMNDVKGETLTTLIEEIQNNFRVSRRELFASEFAVLVALEFSLHIPTWEIFSHYQRLLYDS